MGDVSLLDHLKTIISELEKRIDQRIDGVRDEIRKNEETLGIKLEKMNEFRDTNTDILNRAATKDDIQGLQSSINKLELAMTGYTPVQQADRISSDLRRLEQALTPFVTKPDYEKQGKDIRDIQIMMSNFQGRMLIISALMAAAIPISGIVIATLVN